MCLSLHLGQRGNLFHLLIPAVLCKVFFEISCNLLNTNIFIEPTSRFLNFERERKAKYRQGKPTTSITQSMRSLFNVLVDVPAALTKTTLQEK